MQTTLLDCLGRETAELRAVIALLQAETEALAGRTEPAALSALAERKTAAHDALAALAAERDALLAQAGLPTGHAGAARAVAGDDALGAAWDELNALAIEARALNERNGMLVRTHLRSAQQAIHAIRLATGADLYGADGRQRGGPGLDVRA